MASLSDAELRRRLEGHNFAAPPVTGSTRPLLLKKLAQLDGDNQKSTKGKILQAIISHRGILKQSPSIKSV